MLVTDAAVEHQSIQDGPWWSTRNIGGAVKGVGAGTASLGNLGYVSVANRPGANVCVYRLGQSPTGTGICP